MSRIKPQAQDIGLKKENIKFSMNKDHLTVLPGKSYPLGATVYPEGVNFSLFSRICDKVELLLFDEPDGLPTHIIKLEPAKNKTFYYWHIFITGITTGQLYGFRVYGPYIPEKGLRFDGEKLLLDPYAKAVVTGKHYDRQAATGPGENLRQSMKSAVIDPSDYDWEGDQPLNYPYYKSVIYELHIGGFTKHPNAGVTPGKAGTFAGLVEKIPYLKALGVTSVELMPVQQFDPQDVYNSALTNYWGYSPIALFAPHCQYACSNDPVAVVNEFRDMVKALHKAGIEVILDVVFNHSAEGDENGPTLSFKGLENRAYYMLREDDESKYANFSGTGNTMNANHSIIRRMIMECLRYWVSEMHIDGFRFDLASALSRSEDGEPLVNPPILWSIESDPVLASTKIIAEAWDASGLYQLGTFVGHKWAEWNGRYRDDVRRFVKSDLNVSQNLAQRLLGSPDLFRQIMRDPNRSINFVTCHDGFTLNDLVSYNHKHNLENGEKNRDGHDHNFSWNCGVEGPTNDRQIEKLRTRQVKNLLTVLMLSQGTPMLLMGDEVRRTQHGNNNAYCQDNPTSWFDWDLVNKEKELLSFTRKLVQFNLSHKFFQEKYYWNGREDHQASRVFWHGIKAFEPDWSEHSHALAYTLFNRYYDDCLHVMINAYWEAMYFEIPSINGFEGKNWYRVIDTAQQYPRDFADPDKMPKIREQKYHVKARSVVVLKQFKKKKAKITGRKKNSSNT